MAICGDFYKESLAKVENQRPFLNQTLLEFETKEGKKAEQFENGMEIDYEKKHSIMTLILVLYTFQNDDGRISRFEKKIFKQILRDHKVNLNKQDIKEILDLSKAEIKKDSILKYAKEKHTKPDTLTKAIITVKDYLRASPVYIQILDQIESKEKSNSGGNHVK
ncbi:MAG: hypothetical protein JXB08_06265 [Bacilli bacterium]|nr:hypothetical protein [Bacilli bacterium]MBN2877278.1 hypothetical protein [Bacilli bacterium]